MEDQEKLREIIKNIPGLEQLPVVPVPQNTRVIQYVTQPKYDHLQIIDSKYGFGNIFRLFNNRLAMNILGGVAVPYGEESLETVQQQADFLSVLGYKTAPVDIEFEPNEYVNRRYESALAQQKQRNKQEIEKTVGALATNIDHFPTEWVAGIEQDLSGEQLELQLKGLKETLAIDLRLLVVFPGTN